MRLAAQLEGSFFVFETGEEGRSWISVLGASSAPKPDTKEEQETIERDGGVRAFYVHSSFHAAEIQRERERERESAATEEERQNEEEKEADTMKGWASLTAPQCKTKKKKK